MRGITPFLWFESQAQEAAEFYVSVFPRSRIKQTTRYGDEGPGPRGTVMTVAFELDGQEFVALNGGPQFSFSQAISFVVNCETQAEVDACWEKLSAGGKQIQCGWLTDRYGVPWQIVPTALGRLLGDEDPQRSRRVMKAMMQMKKLDVGELERAYAGG